jgi:hypothetical protein
MKPLPLQWEVQASEFATGLIARGQAAFSGRISPVEPEHYIARVVENGSVVTSLPVAAK